MVFVARAPHAAGETATRTARYGTASHRLSKFQWRRRIGYLIPAAAISNTEHPIASRDAVVASLARRRTVNQPVLDYLKDK